jgi:hypothetical protein
MGLISLGLSTDARPAQARVCPHTTSPWPWRLRAHAYPTVVRGSVPRCCWVPTALLQYWLGGGRLWLQKQQAWRLPPYPQGGHHAVSLQGWQVSVKQTARSILVGAMVRQDHTGRLAWNIYMTVTMNSLLDLKESTRLCLLVLGRRLCGGYPFLNRLLRCA